MTAWGETKSLADWAADPRAKVDEQLIASRLHNGHPPELAIATAKHWHMKGRPLPRPPAG